MVQRLPLSQSQTYQRTEREGGQVYGYRRQPWALDEKSGVRKRQS